MKSQNFGPELKSYLLAKPSKIVVKEIVQRIFDPSGSIAGLSVGMTLNNLAAMGFTPENFGDEHEEFISREDFEDYDPRHSLEYSFVDEVFCSVRYELHASNSDVIALEQGFFEAIQNVLGDPIVVLDTKAWMFGEEAQFILRSSSESVADDGDESGFAPDVQMATVSLSLWIGEDGVFPYSFDPTVLKAAFLSFVNDTYGEKIKIVDAEIWMESPYVYFNIKIEDPEDELDFDWKGAPITDGILHDSFKETVIEEFNHILD